MSLEDRLKRVEEIVSKLNDELTSLKVALAETATKAELTEVKLALSNLSTSVETLKASNEKMYSLLKWVIYILLGIIGIIVGFKVTPPP
jgi:uncharacterized coiled-coil protein SlyX